MTIRKLPLMFCRLLPLVFILNIGYLGSAFAQDSIPPEYTDIVKQAIAEYKAGRLDEARSLFRRAHKIYPNARTLRGMGIASFELSDYVSTIKFLQQALIENRKPLSDKQRIDVKEILIKADGFVGRLKFVLAPSDAHLNIDGVPIELEDEYLLINPGKHGLVATAEGYKRFQFSIDVWSGRKDVLEITLEPMSDSNQNTQTSTHQNKESIPKGDQDGSPSILPYVVMGVGGALLVGSGVTGIIAYSAESKLEKECDEDGCPEEYESTLETRDISLVTSFVLLGTGIAALAAGLVILLTIDSELEPSSTSSVSLRCNTNGCLGMLSSVF